MFFNLYSRLHDHYPRLVIYSKQIIILFSRRSSTGEIALQHHDGCIKQSHGIWNRKCYHVVERASVYIDQCFGNSRTTVRSI